MNKAMWTVFMSKPKWYVYSWIMKAAVSNAMHYQGNGNLPSIDIMMT